MSARFSLLRASVSERLGRNRDVLTDAVLLVLILNAGRLLPALAVAPWTGQVAALLVFFVALSPGQNASATGWKLYLRRLPGYAITAAVAAAVLGWWFKLPPAHAALGPGWLAATALRRWLPGLSRATNWARQKQLECIAGDCALLAAFAFAAPRWTRESGPGWLALALLAAAWALAHVFFGWHERTAPRRRSLGTSVLLPFSWWLLAGAPGGGLLVFAGWFAAALLVFRLAARRWAADDAGGGEIVRWIALGGLVFAFFHPFVHFGAQGASDAAYYATFLADALAQFRHGVFPAWVGQTEHQFNGSVMPIRIAPGFQYLGGLLDLLTFRTLGVISIQNMLVFLAAAGGVGVAYACLRRLGTRPWIAGLLAALYLLCPGSIGLAYNTDLYMSWLTFPVVPLALFLSMHSYATGGPRFYAALGMAVGIPWWLHPPVALWLTAIAASFQLVRLFARRAGAGLRLREFGAGGAVFLLVTAFPVVSTVAYPPDTTLGPALSLSRPDADTGVAFSKGELVRKIRADFPGPWRPVSPAGRAFTDFQLGYALVFLGLASVVPAWRSGRIELRVALGLLVWFALALLPVPWVSTRLWQLVPGTAINVTNIWVTQRFYLLVAALVAFLAAVALGRARRPWVTGGIVVALLWSGHEARKFLHGSWEIRQSRAPSTDLLRSENILLTRYSYGLFGARPRYFTHGVTDPALENRVLAEDLRTIVIDNYRAAAAGGGAATGDHALVAGPVGLGTKLPLGAGQSHLVELVAPADASVKGTLIFAGRSVQRVYALPEYGESHSFGLGGQHQPFIPFRLSDGAADELSAVFVPEDRSATASLDGRIHLRLIPYAPSALPIRVQSWIPYRAAVRTPVAGWLETPRLFQPAYRATLDGKSAEVRRSAQGLAAVWVPAGDSVVVLRYVAPLGLAMAFWLSFLTLAVGIGGVGLTCFRALRPPAAPV